MRCSLATALSLAVAGCSSGSLTQIVVVVRSDLAIPARLDAIVIDVTGTSNGTESSMAPLTGPGAVSLPAILTLVHRGGPLGPIHVTARAQHAGTDVVQSEAQVSFVTDKVLELDLDLVQSCTTMTCAARTCGASGCRNIAIPILPEWHGGQSGMDASTPTDAPTAVDAAHPDAGPDGGPSCTALFGTATDFRLCDEQPNGCEMSVTLNNANCFEFCAAHGAGCMDAWDNEGTAYCTHVSHNGCLQRAHDNICLCDR